MTTQQAAKPTQKNCHHSEQVIYGNAAQQSHQPPVMTGRQAQLRLLRLQLILSVSVALLLLGALAIMR